MKSVKKQVDKVKFTAGVWAKLNSEVILKINWGFNKHPILSRMPLGNLVCNMINNPNDIG